MLTSRSPFTAQFRVRDTRGYVIRDALVYVVGVPFGRIQTPAEVATAMDGVATIQLVPTARLPLVKGGFLVPVTGKGLHRLELTFTAMGCPATDFIEDDIRERLLREPGVDVVRIEVVWDPVWTRARIREEARATMRRLGIVA